MQLKMLRTQVTFQLRLQDHDNILGFDMSTDFESRFEGWASQIKAAISSKSKKLDALKKEHSARFRRNPFPDNPRAEALAECPLHEAIQALEQSAEKENPAYDSKQSRQSMFIGKATDLSVRSNGPPSTQKGTKYSSRRNLTSTSSINSNF